MDGVDVVFSLGHQLLQGSIFYLFFMNNNPEEVGTLGHLLVTVVPAVLGQEMDRESAASFLAVELFPRDLFIRPLVKEELSLV